MAQQSSQQESENRSNTSKKRVEKRVQRLAFDQLGLSPQMLLALAAENFVKPTPIQAGLIPLAMEQYDVVGQARTGTGKTASFAIPILEQLDYQDSSRHPQALVLVPTRELCVQVLETFKKLGDPNKVRSVAIYGGHPIRRQMKQLSDGATVVVGTPGRVIDHLERGTLNLNRLWCVVLDEADRMLDVGFRPAIEKILRRCPEDRQTLMLSATVPPPIAQLARRYMDHPKLINFSGTGIAVETIDQQFFNIFEDQKFDLLLKLLQRDDPKQAIVFCRTKLRTESLFRKLSKNKLFAERFDHTQVGSIHGDMAQSARDRTMKRFRDGSVRFLIATDVVGRGIDVTGISHIINYDVPELSDDYVHRVGRTGRMGNDGVAYTFVSPVERKHLKQIEKRINFDLTMDEIEGFDKPEYSSKGDRSGRRYRRAL